MAYSADVIDMTDSKLAAMTIAQLRAVDPATCLIKVPAMDGGVEYVVATILANFKPRELNVLRFWGHGGHGVQEINVGQQDNSWVKHNGLAVYDLETSNVLAQTKSRFYNAKSRIELHGCETGGGTEGPDYMKKLARLMGVRVLASPVVQSGCGWYGKVFQADPDGKFSTVYYTASPGPDVHLRESY